MIVAGEARSNKIAITHGNDATWLRREDMGFARMIDGSDSDGHQELRGR